MAKKLNVERVFAGIAVPEHKTFMVFKAPSFEAVRSLMVQTGRVQTDEVTIRQVETYEFLGSLPLGGTTTLTPSSTNLSQIHKSISFA